MKEIRSLLKVKKAHELVLLALLVFYIVIDVHTPEPLNSVFGSVYGNVAVCLASIYLFIKCNKTVGVIAMIAAYYLVKRSNNSLLGTFAANGQPRWKAFSGMNDFPITLEEEMVSKMAPLAKHEGSSDAEYKPVLTNLHEAANADYSDIL